MKRITIRSIELVVEERDSARPPPPSVRPRPPSVERSALQERHSPRLAKAQPAQLLERRAS